MLPRDFLKLLIFVLLGLAAIALVASGGLIWLLTVICEHLKIV